MDGICGCLVKLSADVSQIRSNDERQSCIKFYFYCPVPAGYQRLEMIDFQSLTETKETERRFSKPK